MILVENLSKVYRKQEVLRDITQAFAMGTVYGLVGPNGCGKTTLMRCICGLAQPTGGHVTVEGKRVGKDVDFAPSTGMIIEEPGFLAQLSGLRNLQVLASLSPHGRAEEAAKAMAMLGLDPDDKKPVGKYSLGMRQRLGIAQAIMEDPNNLILDEPFNALDKQGVAEVHDLLRRLRDRGKTIVLASHSAADIARACDVTLEMRGGRLFQM